MFRSRLFIITLLLAVCWGACKQAPKDHERKSLVAADAEPVVISAKHQDASCVYLTVDETLNPLMSWVEVDSTTQKKSFYFSRFDASTNVFGAPISIPIPQNTSIHEEGMPKVAVKSDGTLVAIYETSEPLEGSKWGLGDVRYLQSFDQGTHWTSAQSVAPKDYQAHLSGSFSGMTRLSDGEVGIAWLGTAQGESGRPVKFVKTIGKEGLTDPVVIDQQACECCRIAMDQNGADGLVVAYRSLRGDNIRDIAIAQSKDNGQTFQKPFSFSGDNWRVNGCPHNGPSLSILNHQILVGWFTGKQGEEGVHYARLDSVGQSLEKKRVASDGQFIQVDFTSENGQFMVYNQDYQGPEGKMQSRIVVEKNLEGASYKKEVSLPGSQANYPVLKHTENGSLLVAWSDEGRIFYRLLTPGDIDGMDASTFLTHY